MLCCDEYDNVLEGQKATIDPQENVLDDLKFKFIREQRNEQFIDTWIVILSRVGAHQEKTKATTLI